jgi:hypothetical protein
MLMLLLLLCRRAFELAHSSTYLFAGTRPQAGALSGHLPFLQPVLLSMLLRRHRLRLCQRTPTADGCVRHAEGPAVQSSSPALDRQLSRHKFSWPAAVEVEQVTFQRPVSVGDLMRLKSWVAHTWVAPSEPTKVRCGCASASWLACW